MRRDEQRLLDILEALDWIIRATAGLTEDGFVKNETLCYAIAYRLSAVGEAAARLSGEIRERNPDVQWSDSSARETSSFINTLVFTGRSSGKPPTIMRQCLRSEFGRSCRGDCRSNPVWRLECDAGASRPGARGRVGL